MDNPQAATQTSSRRTRIVCTIGPASWSPATLRQMLQAGMNVARINFSHAAYDSTKLVIANLRQISAELDVNLAILADLQGPRIRVGAIPDPGLTLINGAAFTLYTNPNTPASAQGAPIDYPALANDVKVGDTVLIDDGLLELCVTATAPGQVHTVVVNGGLLGSHKGINVPGVTLSTPTITEKDKADLAFALDQQVDAVALSFVRSADDVQELRRLIAAHGDARPLIISKIEKHEAVRHDNFAAILAASDGIMVARGDLGVEMAAEELPILQKWMIRLTRAAGKPVITATQMLDSMIRNPRPTRAEATDVANAIFDGTDATMLSGESASGLYPVLAVQTMARIAVRAEQDYLADPAGHLLATDVLSEDCREDERVSQAVSETAAELALQLGAKAIVTLTRSGYTARQIAKHRTAIPVLAVTNSAATYRQLALTWGVIPYKVESFTTIVTMLDAAERTAITAGLAQAGDTIVISAGLPLNQPGNTNILKVQVVGEQQ